MRSFCTKLVITLTVLACFAMPAFAAENGLTNYPIGANTVLNGLQPAPGQTYYYQYMQYYSSDENMDSNGDNALPGFEADVFAIAFKGLHTWNQTVGPFTLTSGGVISVAYVDMDLGFDAPGVTTSDDTFRLGDITLMPLNIGWSNSSHTLFAYMGLDVVLPVGAYSSSELVNAGNNHFSFQPGLSVTWFAAPKLELGATTIIEYGFENQDTDYKNGTMASFEYVAGYHVTDKLQLGIQGFFLTQLNDDEQNGDKVSDSKTKVSAIGPQIRYDLKPGTALLAKWQHEFGAENHTEGDRFWLQFAMPF